MRQTQLEGVSLSPSTPPLTDIYRKFRLQGGKDRNELPSKLKEASNRESLESMGESLHMEVHSRLSSQVAMLSGYRFYHI